MILRLLLSPKAEADLEEIWNHTADRWGAVQTEIYIRGLWQAMSDITAHPAMGADCSDVRAGYRKFKSGAHVIFYRQIMDAVEIMRVLHERMDFERHV